MSDGLRANRASALVLMALVAGTAAADPADIDALAATMAGRFDSECQCASGSASPGERFVDWRQRIDAPALGPYVFYQQLNQGEHLDLYRQRILVLAVDDQTGVIAQRAYALRRPERYVDARAGDEAFAALGEADVEPVFRTGCDQVWRSTDHGFVGYTDPATCRIVSRRTGKPRRIEARTTLAADGLSLVERGYDDDGKQLFGTPPGESLSLWRVEP